MRTEVKHFIPCHCGEHGLLTQGIYFESDPDIPSLVYYTNTHEFARNTNVWGRLRYAWRIFWGHEIYTDDVILDKKGVIKLLASCQDILDRWPEIDDRVRYNTLDRFYQEAFDEEVGRKLRLEKEGSDEKEV